MNPIFGNCFMKIEFTIIELCLSEIKLQVTECVN
jgi:hypothetical protein